MTHQTNAQRLADRLEDLLNDWIVVNEAADELRRLSAIEQERDQLRAKLEVAEASAKAAISKAEWQAVTNTELNQLRAQLAVLKDGQAGGEVVTVTGKLGDLCSFHSLSVRKGDTLYTSYVATPKPVPMTDEQRVWAINQIMEQAQVFASAWSLVGGRFDMGDGMAQAEAEKLALRKMVEANHGISEVQG